MNKTIRCLLVEDSEDDALLVLAELRRGGYTVTHERVETPEAMRAALDRQPWDIVIADYKMPRFSGLGALELLKGSGTDLPSIVVSGTIGEDIAVKMMQAGAHDYIIKGKLARLVPAVERELSDAEGRREGKRAEEALKLEQALLTNLLRTSPDHIYFKNRQSRFIRINDKMTQSFGLRSPADAVGKSDFDFFTEEHARQAYEDEQQVMRTGKPLVGIEEKETWPDGRVTWVSTNKVPLRDADGNFTGLVGISRDITERMQAEEALRLAHERLRRFVDSNIIGIVIAVTDGEVIEANDYFLRLVGHTREELTQGKINWRTSTPPEWLPASEHAFEEMRKRGSCLPYEKEYLRPDGTRVPVLLADAMLPGPREEVAAFAIDLTERKRTEEALRQQSEEIRVRNERLTRFNATAVGRELRMIELKREVNELCQKLGEPPRHRVTGNEPTKQAELELPG